MAEETTMRSMKERINRYAELSRSRAAGMASATFGRSRTFRDRREIVYVSRFPARSTIASSVNIGTRFPAHATIMGRMTICELDDKELARLFRDQPLQRFTRQTPTTIQSSPGR